MIEPRKFVDEGYEIVDASTPFEEEAQPHYTAEAFYPARNGEIIHERYQLTAKVGYGTSSTVWTAQDLQDGTFWAMKIVVNTMPDEYRTHEIDVYRHLAAHGSPSHPGKKHVGELRDAFELQGPHGTHQVLVLTASGMTLGAFRCHPGYTMSTLIARLAVKQAVLAVNYLHSADIIYTDLHADNLLIGVSDQADFESIARLEATTPSPRKYVDGTVIHSSLGRVARIGPKHEGIVMPEAYRAPEVILGMPWDSNIDMWNVGLLAWNLVEENSLFHLYKYESREQSTARHLASMVALIGPPPSEFLNRNKPETSKYWDDQGNWIASPAVPEGGSFESFVKNLNGREKTAFIDFMRSLLRWLPEERPFSAQAYGHPWLNRKSDLDDKDE